MRIVPIWDHSTRPAGVPYGPDRWFRCLRCLGCVSSIPQVDARCHCGNVGYDWDAWRYIKDETQAEAILLEPDERPPAGINWEDPPGPDELRRLVESRPKTRAPRLPDRDR